MNHLNILLASRSDTVCAFLAHVADRMYCEHRVTVACDEDVLEAALAEGTPELLFLDWSFAEGSTVALTARLSREYRGLRIVIFTVSGHAPDNAALFIRKGAESFLCLSAGLQELEKAGALIMHGKRYLPSDVLAALARRDREPRARGALTRREKDVGRLLAAGMTVPEIAAVLSLSPKTVDSHRSRLYEKTDSQKRSEFYAYALRTGLVPGEDECLSN